MAARGGAGVRAPYSCEHWEIVKPSVSELSREVRSNILCTVKGCGKVLPNPPALNMHLVKSHGVQEGINNPTLRKDLKSSQKLYCCPIEGCPRGTNRPFSQFSRVKQHFMKMHAEKKHKCEKCGNSYGTEWDLKRHIGYCGKTFKCTCGCPYASRTALLSHTHRMGHEIPLEHRDPPVKKRKLDELKQTQKTVTEECVVEHDQSAAVSVSDQKMAASKTLPASATLIAPYVTRDMPPQPNQAQKLLLPKPKLTFIKLPIMQLAHLPVLVSSSECSVKPVVVAVNNHGPVISTLQIVPQNETVLPRLETETTFHSSSLQASALRASNSYIQVTMETPSPTDSNTNMDVGPPKNKITSDVQTDLSIFSATTLPCSSWTASELCVSSSSQTDLSFSSQMTLPISVETQTLEECSLFRSNSQAEASINSCLACGVSRETQTSMGSFPVDQTVSCDIFNNANSFYTVSTQTSQANDTGVPGSVGQNLLNTETVKSITEDEIKSSSFISFNSQNGTFPAQNMTDNQTQTMELLNDLEKILSDNISSQPLENRNLLSAGESHLSSNCNPNAAIDFDIDEFFSASNIQTQTEESMMSNLNSEYLDIETQTDFFFSNDASQSFSNKGSSSLLGMETFDTQTQTDLNFFLDNNSHLRLGNLLKQSSFSISTDSSDAESHADGASTSKSMACPSLESQVHQNSAQTQTTDSCFETLGSLFLTSNETQTAMNDFLLADLAWNTMESQFSSVETQTSEERYSLFSEKSEN